MQSQVETKWASGEQGWHPVDVWVNGWDKGVCVCMRVCNTTLFCCRFWLHYCIRSALPWNFC